jgi:hypothetical protein
MSDTTTIPARRGKAAYVAAKQVIRVINTHGEQVVDTWAFNRHDISEFMSMEHTRSWLRRLIPHVGDSLVTNHRRPILTVLEDTSGGIHDTLLAACDHYRYEQLGCTEYHDNCTDNLAQGLAELGVKPPDTPSPLNLFMNIPWISDGSLTAAIDPCGRSLTTGEWSESTHTHRSPSDGPMPVPHATLRRESPWTNGYGRREAAPVPLETIRLWFHCRSGIEGSDATFSGPLRQPRDCRLGRK